MKLFLVICVICKSSFLFLVIIRMQLLDNEKTVMDASGPSFNNIRTS